MTMKQMTREPLNLSADPVSEVADAWRIEVRRRCAEIEAGTAECRDGEEVLREIEERLR